MGLIKISQIVTAMRTAARSNPSITSASLRDQVKRRDLSGWRHLREVLSGSFDDWIAAAGCVAGELAELEDMKAKAAARRIGF